MKRHSKLFTRITVFLFLAACTAQAHEYRRPITVQPTDLYERWHQNILTTVFWVGEPSVGEGWSANRASAWDASWVKSYGGTDSPNHRNGFHPVSFTPKQNPFYIALPFNDLIGSSANRSIVRSFLNFWRETVNQPRTSKSICKNRWIAITYQGKTCYAQWQDVGPITHDDADYVFGFKEPKSQRHHQAGLDISPAVRDYLAFNGRCQTNWRFVQESELPAGPWLDIVTRD